MILSTFIQFHNFSCSLSLSKILAKFWSHLDSFEFQNFGLGDGQRSKSQYRSYLTCTIFFTPGFNVIKLLITTISSNFIQFHSFLCSLSKFLKILAKFWSHLDYFEFQKYRTRRWPKIKKSISQLPNIHFIFYSWVQCYKTFYIYDFVQFYSVSQPLAFAFKAFEIFWQNFGLIWTLEFQKFWTW